MKVSLHSSTFPLVDLAALSRFARTLQIEGVELRLSEKQAHGIHLNCADAHLRRSARLLLEEQLAVTCLGSAIHAGDVEERTVERICEIALVLQCRLVRIFADSKRDGENDEHHCKRIGTSLELINKVFASHEVVALLENHGEWSSLSRLANCFEKQGLLLDIGHSFLSAEGLERAMAHAHRIQHLHVKDFIIGPEGRVNVPLFTGNCGVAECIRRLRYCQFKGFVSAEISSSTGEEDIKSIKSLIISSDDSLACQARNDQSKASAAC